jgi:curved DNA-binding protein CbpA
MNPYQVLGVRKNATPKSIKAAFHRKAKETHPDTGGNASAFQEVNLAWDILSDPARKARYDATGDASEDKPDNQTAEALQVLSAAFLGVVNKAIQQGVTADKIDLVDSLRQTIREQMANLRKALEGTKKFREAVEAMTDRLSVKEGANLLESLRADYQRRAVVDGEKIAASLACHERALTLLERHEYRFEKVVIRSAGLWFTSQTATTNGW